MMNASIEERLLKRIRIVKQCWEWQGFRKNGYGLIVVKKRERLVHRVSYETFIGTIPKGLILDHLCRNRACINPWHLEPVTIAENTRRGKPLYQRDCIHGHEYTSANTIRNQLGHRKCRTCDNIHSRRFYYNTEQARRKAKRRARLSMDSSSPIGGSFDTA